MFLFFRTFFSCTHSSDSVVENLSLGELSCSIKTGSSQNSNYSYVSIKLFVHNIFANYTFFLAQMTDSAKKKEDRIADYARSLAENVEKLVNHQINMSRPKEPKIKMKHEVMLLNLDRMLSKLPNDIVENLNMKFVSIIYDEITKEAAKNKNS